MYASTQNQKRSLELRIFMRKRKPCGFWAVLVISVLGIFGYGGIIMYFNFTTPAGWLPYPLFYFAFFKHKIFQTVWNL